MSRIRVLVVDDSVVVRKIVCEALDSGPDIIVAGTAATGSIALSKIPQLSPDVVTLDVEMPGLNGIETLKEIRRLYPKLPVIMFSTLTERGAAVTLEALSAGASDYVTKPSNSASLSASIADVRQQLIDKIILLARRNTTLQQAPVAPRFTSSSGASRVDILAIGTSTGGPNALGEVIPALPGDLGVPVVVVQHMPPLFTRLLAERLNTRAAMPVREGQAGVKLEGGEIWIAPGNYHMAVVRRGDGVFLDLNQDPPENSCRPAVDVLFRSVSRVYGSHVLGVVMTGMGADGARGAEAIRETGGQVIAQDEPTSVVWGMPGAVVNSGLANQVCPLQRIAGEVVRRVNRKSYSHSESPSTKVAPAAPSRQ